MMDTSKMTRRWLRLAPILVLVFSFVAGIAVAGDTKDAGGGWINPTNFPVIDDDVCYSVLTEQPAAGQIDALGAHLTATGAGVTVAVLDAGFNLANPMIAGHLHPVAYDALDRDSDPNDSGNGIDDDADGDIDPAIGHGTFVAGMVLMAAPDATIMAIRVADDEGYGSSESIVRGIYFATKMGADVINLSLKVNKHDYDVVDALQVAENYGVVIVVSGGNDGVMKDDELDSIAELDWIVGVGSVDETDTISSFTSLPTEEWLRYYAPGVDLWGPYGYPEDDTVAWWSGTSFSAGIVSGGIALLLETDPGVDSEDVRDALLDSSDTVYRDDGSVLAHAGRINLRQLVD